MNSIARETFALVEGTMKFVRVAEEDKLIWTTIGTSKIFEVNFMKAQGKMALGFEGFADMVLRITKMVPNFGFFELARKLLHSQNMLLLLASLISAIQESGVQFEWADLLCVLIDFEEAT